MHQTARHLQPKYVQYDGQQERLRTLKALKELLHCSSVPENVEYSLNDDEIAAELEVKLDDHNSRDPKLLCAAFSCQHAVYLRQAY